MTERLRSLPVLLAVTLLLAALGAMIAAEETQALKCRPGQCPPEPEEAPQEEAPKPQPQPQPTPTMLVIGVGWDNGVPAESSVLESGRNAEYVDFFRGHFNEWFAKQASPAPFRKWSATDGGEYLIAPPTLPPGALGDPFDPDFRGCENLDFVDEIWARAEAKARQSGFNPDNYSAVVVQWYEQPCFAGVFATDTGRHFGLTKPKFAFHEFGHYYGLGHASLLRCKDSADQLVTLSSKCGAVEYVDDWSAMGKYVPDSAFGAADAKKLGWLGGQFFDVPAGDYTKTYFLKPFTDPAHTERALRLEDGQILWLEYRTELGVDHEAFSGHKVLGEEGLIIHRELPSGASQLLDMTPGSGVQEGKDGTRFVSPSADATDAYLPVGQTWVNPLGEMRITLNSVSSAGASVTISSGKVTVPDFRSLAPSQVGAVLESAGLRFGGWRGTPDWFCNDIGRVVEQYPYAGARVLPGAAISLTLGEQPPYCL